MIQLFYFSGTGNTLHIAKEAGKLFPDCTVTPMISALRSPEKQIKAEVVGFIFPVYAFSIPQPLKQLLTGKSFQSTTYFFAVASRHCSHKVFRRIDKLLSRQNKKLNARFFSNGSGKLSACVQYAGSKGYSGF